jgi:hypothetical protein
MRTSAGPLFDRYRVGCAERMAAWVIIVIRNLEEVCVDLGCLVDFHLLRG